MKYLLISALVLFPFLAKAEAPIGVFGFLDGKYYDATQTLRFYCFSDGNCYDMNQQYVFSVTPTNTNPVADNAPGIVGSNIDAPNPSSISLYTPPVIYVTPANPIPIIPTPPPVLPPGHSTEYTHIEAMCNNDDANYTQQEQALTDKYTQIFYQDNHVVWFGPVNGQLVLDQRDYNNQMSDLQYNQAAERKQCAASLAALGN